MIADKVPLVRELPLPLKKYISKNWKPETQWKLIKASQAFFHQNPIIPVKRFSKTRNLEIFEIVSIIKGDYKQIRINITQIKVKFWVTDFFGMRFPPHPVNYFEVVKPCIYRCNLCCLSLYDLNLTEDDWELLIAGATLETFRIFSIVVTRSDGTIIPTEELINNIDTKSLQLLGINEDTYHNGVESTHPQNLRMYLQRIKAANENE